MKRIFISVIVLVITIIPSYKCTANDSSYWTDEGIRATYFSKVNGTTITITSAAEMGLLCYNVNNGNPYTGYTFILSSDIDLSGHYIPPIGTSLNPFSGVFDGRGYKLTNVYVNANLSYVALWGYLSSTSEVKNLTMTGSVTNTSSNGVGAIILYGLYALFGDTVLPTLKQKVEDMFKYSG